MSTKNQSLQDRFWNFASYGFIILLVASIVGPYSIVVFSSFKSRQEIFGGLNLIPKAPTLEAWASAFDALAQPLLNSLAIALGTAILSLLITIPGAYVFGRKEFPGKEYGFYAIISALLFPHLILVVPIGSWWLEYGLYNTIPGLWIAYQAFVTPMAIWVLRDFFEGLPDNIEEAARVFGCSQFEAFIRVVLPLSAPAIAAVGFLSFLSGWNDFLFANLLTNNTGPQTAVVALFNTVNSGEQVLWSRMMAAVIIVGVPPLVLYLISRRYLGNAFSVS